jgi:hypothetical protein
MEWRPQALRFWLIAFVILLVQSSAVDGWNHLQTNARKIKEIVDALKKELGIDAGISIAVVPQNDLLASVEPVKRRAGSFRMSFDATFLAMLDEQDLPAVVAHELGHVWIFTHHPYLHTEELANSIAYRLVTETAMDRVYEKVQLVKGPPSNLSAKLRPERGLN